MHIHTAIFQHHICTKIHIFIYISILENGFGMAWLWLWLWHGMALAWLWLWLGFGFGLWLNDWQAACLPHQPTRLAWLLARWDYPVQRPFLINAHRLPRAVAAMCPLRARAKSTRLP